MLADTLGSSHWIEPGSDGYHDAELSFAASWSKMLATSRVDAGGWNVGALSQQASEYAQRERRPML